MEAYWKLLWRRLSERDSKDKVEVERISALQKSAVGHRAEYAQTKEQAASASDGSFNGLLDASRRRMREAEAAYTVALQQWENKQSRQKSR